MTPGERIKYHSDLWPIACLANEWDVKDKEKRQQVVLDCMAAVRGPLVTTSAPEFGRDEVTALFCYLEFLADQGDLEKSARWLDCQTDYRAYNRARQADWYQGKLGSKPGDNRLVKNRFGGAKTAVGGPLESFDPKAIKARFLTVATRAQKKIGRARGTTASQIGLTPDPKIAPIPMPASTPANPF